MRAMYKYDNASDTPPGVKFPERQILGFPLGDWGQELERGYIEPLGLYHWQ